MSSQEKLEKIALTSTYEEPCQDNLFVQTEGELLEAYLEAIADELMKLNILYTDFRNELKGSS